MVQNKLARFYGPQSSAWIISYWEPIGKCPGGFVFYWGRKVKESR